LAPVPLSLPCISSFDPSSGTSREQGPSSPPCPHSSLSNGLFSGFLVGPCSSRDVFLLRPDLQCAPQASFFFFSSPPFFFFLLLFFLPVLFCYRNSCFSACSGMNFGLLLILSVFSVVPPAVSCEDWIPPHSVLQEPVLWVGSPFSSPCSLFPIPFPCDSPLSINTTAHHWCWRMVPIAQFFSPLPSTPLFLPRPIGPRRSFLGVVLTFFSAHLVVLHFWSPGLVPVSPCLFQLLLALIDLLYTRLLSPLLLFILLVSFFLLSLLDSPTCSSVLDLFFCRVSSVWISTCPLLSPPPFPFFRER